MFGCVCIYEKLLFVVMNGYGVGWYQYLDAEAIDGELECG